MLREYIIRILLNINFYFLKLITEIQIHKSLNNETVVKFEEFFEDKQFVYLLLELCPHKSLLKLIQYRKRLSEDEVRYYLRDMLNALEYFKSEKILHRDLKLGNILLDGNMKLKIGMFIILLNEEIQYANIFYS